MTEKISGRQVAAFQKEAEKHQKTTLNKEGTFQETLEAKTTGSGKSLPIFPHHKARPKEITTAQANKLAQYAPLIQKSAARHQVPIELVCGVILQESGCNAKAKSPVGAKGLMQLMDGTAQRLGVTNSYDPAQNIEGGTKHLRELLNRYNGDVELTLAAYNAGEQNVTKHGGVPPFRETKNYIPNVLGYAQAMIRIFQQQQPQQPAPSIAIRDKMA
ncbi:MAG: lytic transglycosylase domain-containing protein [Deltaproteobacteria bacterium]|nr:lytic transglycosylase domain-containing protein [Deltaproteobacteria bacterium]